MCYHLSGKYQPIVILRVYDLQQFMASESQQYISEHIPQI